MRRIWLMVMPDGKLVCSVLGGFGRDVNTVPERGGSARRAPVHVYFVKVCCVRLHAATRGAWPGLHLSSSQGGALMSLTCAEVAPGMANG